MQEVDLYGDKEAWQIFEGDHTNTHYCITQLKKKKADSIRTERSVGKGKWNLQSKAKQVFDHNGRLMGYVKSLKYIPRTAHKSSIKAAYGEWLMTEYSLRYSYLNDIKKKGYVICKIKKKKKNDSDKQKGVANDDQNMSDIEEYIDSILKEENNENIEYIEGEEVGEHFLATLGCHDDLPVNNRHELALAGGSGPLRGQGPLACFQGLLHYAAEGKEGGWDKSRANCGEGDMGSTGHREGGGNENLWLRFGVFLTSSELEERRMGFAYCVWQPNGLHCGEALNYKILDRKSGSCVGLDYKLLGNARVLCKKSSTGKRLKRIGGCSDNSLAYSRRIQLSCALWKSDSSGNLAGVKGSRGVKLLRCQGNDSLAFIDGNGRNVESSESAEDGGSLTASTNGIAEISSATELEEDKGEEKEGPQFDELRELLQKALKDLEVAQMNSTMFEEKAQTISEAAIALKDEAAHAWDDVNKQLDSIQEIVGEEMIAKEAVQKATMALSLAEARLLVALDSIQAAKQGSMPSKTSEESKGQELTSLMEEEAALSAVQEDIEECRDHLENCEAILRRVQNKKEELQKEVDRLNDLAEQAQINALKAEEDVSNIMLLAEQAVAYELEATQRVSDAEIALQKAEKNLAASPVDNAETSAIQNGSSTLSQVSVDGTLSEDEVFPRSSIDSVIEKDREVQLEDAWVVSGPLSDASDDEDRKLVLDSSKDFDSDAENPKSVQTVRQEANKESAKDSSSLNAPKALLKKSSRFLPASFFSSSDGEEFTPASVFQSLLESARNQLPKLVVGSLVMGAGIAFYANRSERIFQSFQQPDIITTSIDEINEEEASLFDMLWLLLASVIFVPIFQKIPGGSPVLGYLAAGILIGPYGLSIIRHVHGTKAIAEFGVVFLLFNIGLELSVERLSSMKKYVFGLGTAQVLVTAVVVGLVANLVAGQAGPAAIVIGNGLALSSTAVVLQVLQERGESTSRHGRATFSVLLFQDLAVVVLLILIPLISPNSSKGGVGFRAIAEALGLAAVKAIVAITAIIAGGRLLLRPIYKQIAENQNAEIFSANTLLVILGTSLLTARAGLSMALGAFLAGLLLAETEFSLQVESDIAPYRGLLLGLFFMTVGMSIDPKLLLSNFSVIMGSLGLLLGGKTILVALVGKLFGISIVSAIRVGLLLAPGGEFAFVAFGEAVNQGIMSSELSSLLFLVVGISMALTPYLAAGGQLIASRFELQDVRSLLPVESETDDLQDHIIICGFGRVGQIIAQLLSERLIPFVALDVRSDRVAVGRALDLPVYFGDAGSREVLHKVGAERACAAAITLDTPGANYRTVWALNKYFPNVKTFVRAHDVDHGLNLEKAGATAVVPETLEPSLQLAAAVLAQAKLPMSEIAATINEFRSRHLSELTELCQTSGSSLGYGFSRVAYKAKAQPSDSSDENQVGEGTLAI
ncbi:K(+) efflux antiporter 1, chloroplastic [Capsicum annuum]|nr:K(+) efflux antiporter 1, chloroplastic [Capsicum annuum]KAF3641356.1 K(+) efflux antiporter 1, chloroplastic [Capsicum annuum]